MAVGDFIQKGDVLDIIAGGAVVAKTVQQIGQLVGVALEAAAASGDVYPLGVSGVYEINCADATYAAGQLASWNGTQVDNVAPGAGDLIIGHFVEAKTTVSGFVKVRLDGAAREDEVA